MSLMNTDVANAVTTDTIPQVEVKQTLNNELGTAYSEQQIKNLVDEYAIKYGVDGNKMMEVIKCESMYKNVQSNHYYKGVREDSWGIAQIHLPSHPNVSKQQALDPLFSINFMAEKFSRGWFKWSCYR
mgnify:CR=1 FL=1